MEKTVKKLNKKRVVLFFVILLCMCGLVFSLFKIGIWLVNSINTKKQINEINEIVEIEEVPIVIDDGEEVETPEEEQESSIYFDYMNMSLINVNFSELKELNSSTVGWIQVQGTNVNYPFVQTTDNDYYINHSFDKSWNGAGWVFLDYRNDSLNDKNNIIYAHSMLDGTMFGTLHNVFKSSWFNNRDNHVIKISTEEANSLWQVFSVYHVPTTNDYMQIDFSSDEDFVKFSNMLIDRSAYNFNTKVSGDDKILTLSTCYLEDERTIVHAKLIEYSER